MRRTERAAPPVKECVEHRLDFQKSMTYMFIYARRGKVPTCHWFTGRDGLEYWRCFHQEYCTTCKKVTRWSLPSDECPEDRGV